MPQSDDMTESEASSLLYHSHTKQCLIRSGLTWYHKVLARYSPIIQGMTATALGVEHGVQALILSSLGARHLPVIVEETGGHDSARSIRPNRWAKDDPVRIMHA